MAITSSAKKALRQSIRRKARNLQKKDKLKNLLKQVRFLALQKKTEEANKLLPQLYQALDKAAKTGLIKNNAASRQKSRIVKLIAKSR
jgi:small subunit ribosomal protein S20